MSHPQPHCRWSELVRLASMDKGWTKDTFFNDLQSIIAIMEYSTPKSKSVNYCASFSSLRITNYISFKATYIVLLRYTNTSDTCHYREGRAEVDCRHWGSNQNLLSGSQKPWHLDYPAHVWLGEISDALLLLLLCNHKYTFLNQFTLKYPRCYSWTFYSEPTALRRSYGYFLLTHTI